MTSPVIFHDGATPAARLPAPWIGVDHRPATVVRQPAGDLPCRGLSIPRVAMYACATVAFLFVNRLGLAGNAVFFLIIGGMMLYTPMAAVAGFSCAVLGLAANVAFVAKSIVFTFSRVLSLGLLATRFTLAGNTSFLGTAAFRTLTLFCVTAAFCSVMTGYYTSVALIKALVFWTGMTGYFAMVATIRQRRIDTTEWFVAQTAVVAMLSALSIVLGVSQNFKGTNVTHGLYNLAFYHSNAAGPIFALLVVYLVNVILFAGHRNRWMCLPIAAFLTYCLWLTRSRTGMGTLLSGTLLAVGLATVWHRNRLFTIRLNYPRWLLVALVLGLVPATMILELTTGGRFSSAVRSFAAKTTKEVEELTAEDVMLSRSALINRAWANFEDSPLVGIGFGVSTDPYFIANATLLYAPVEKGFLPAAVLEEVGLLGGVAFAAFLAAMFGTLIRDRSIPGITMLVAFLVSNLGEASFFALGGHASFMWLFVMAGILLGDRCRTAVDRDAVPSRLLHSAA